MKSFLIVLATIVSLAAPAPLNSDVKISEKSEIHAPVPTIKDNVNAGVVKPVALADGVPTVKVSGPTGINSHEVKPALAAENTKELEKPKSSPVAVGHSENKPVAVAPISVPIRDKPAPVKSDAPLRNSQRPVAYTPVHDAAQHSPSVTSHVQSQKDVKQPISNANNNGHPAVANHGH